MQKILRQFILIPSLMFSAALFSQPAWTPEICLVTVDSSTASYISVVWNKPLVSDIDSFYIYRSDSTSGTFTRIAAIDYADSSVYDDIAVNVNTTWYKYTISAIDFSGIESAQSNPANTCLLDVIPNVGAGYYTCQWNVYQNFSNFPFTQRCMWDSTGSGSPTQQVGGNMSPSWSSWNHSGYSMAPSSQYRLEVEMNNSCSPSRAIVNTSRSNIKGVASPFLNADDHAELSFYAHAFPNPSLGGMINLEWNAQLGVKKIEVYDVAGKLIKENIPVENQLKLALNVSNVSAGIYFVRFISTSGTITKKILFE